MDPIRWLHLSDLHLGCRGEALWWQVQEEFEHSIRKHASKLGMPDLTLCAGDLTNRGAEAEFRQLDQFLEALLGSWTLSRHATRNIFVHYYLPGMVVGNGAFAVMNRRGKSEPMEIQILVTNLWAYCRYRHLVPEDLVLFPDAECRF